LTFAEFMRECLYQPQWGYYSRPENRRFADYYTSVDVHPLFGRLLARQLEEMWRLLSRPAEFWAVEAERGQDGWLRTSWISSRGSFQTFMTRCATWL
jgi:SAM-dependent MidA family methyltransferase